MRASTRSLMLIEALLASQSAARPVVVMRKPQAVGLTEQQVSMPEGAEAADRAARLRAGVVAGAPGRSAADIRRSLMAADVEGLPARFSRSGAGCFRSLLRERTAICLVPDLKGPGARAIDPAKVFK